jgi:DNA-binding HxlR family transcriptional regulator
VKPGNLHRTEPCRRISEILSRIGDKWSLLVIRQLGDGPLRFSEIKRGLGSISQKMLTTTLRGLERDGFVERAVYAEVPVRVEYSLTALGWSATELLMALADWADEHLAAVEQARLRYREASVFKANSPADLTHLEAA